MNRQNDLHLGRLRDSLQAITGFRDKRVTAFDPNFKIWKERTKQSLSELFGSEHDYSSRFSSLQFWKVRARVSLRPGSHQEWLSQDQETFDNDLDRAHAILKDALEEFPVLADQVGPMDMEHDSQDDTESSSHGYYVDKSRIQELKAISTTKFDLSKLIKILEEMNVCNQKQCYISLIMLTRALLDHVPPIFSCKNFSEVLNNYAGTKSFKESMAHLENSSRKIADQHLHSQIRQKESLPNKTQVNFSNDIDVLLSEIVRVLK